MKRIVLLVVLCVSLSVFSQRKEKVLITLDGEKITVSEFQRVYEKNLDAIDNEEAKSIVKNVDLYINYKLKVKEAYRLKLDTTPSYKREIKTYKKQLMAPYLQDTVYVNKLVKEAYSRTLKDVKAKHILIKMSRGATPKDTLEAYHKILKLRERIVNGEEFEALAVQFSDDKSAQDDPKTGRKGNKGDLGYFSAFRMVHPFENAAYTTKVGEISMPFKTQFGYHIVQVDDIRASKGEIEAAHILIKDLSSTGKNRIDSIYIRLKNKEKFEVLAKEYSEDTGSKKNGGKLGRFDAGRMVKPFSDAAFSLEKEGDFSKPFKTRFGWHIVKLVKKYPIESFDKVKNGLKRKVRQSIGKELSDKAIIEKLLKKYTIIENEDAKKILNKKNIRGLSRDSLKETLFSINDKNIKQEAFVKYIRNRRHLPIYKLYEMFKEKEVVAYYKNNLIHTEPDYKHTLEEYQDGLLLFELMQKMIWDKSSKDSLGLKKYFEANKNKYKTADLKSVKGQVTNDYQIFLEENWIADLRSKSDIKIHKRELKKLIKFYEKK